MGKIIKLDFKKTSSEVDSAAYGHVDLTDSENLAKVEKYVLPIIAKNTGWDTADVTFEGFKQNPSQYQEALDASLFANIHIALDDNDQPAGLLEYLAETVETPLSKPRMNSLQELINIKAKWDVLLEMKVIDKQLLDRFFPQLEKYISSKKIYSEIGVVVRPDLQGKKSGVSQSLYQILSDGIAFGWTSNPLILAQWRKLFDKVIYYPLLGEELNSLEYLASIAILYADLLTYDKTRWDTLEFGALNSTYFVSARSNYYLELAKTLAEQTKITKLDLERVNYCLQRNAVQGAVFAFS